MKSTHSECVPLISRAYCLRETIRSEQDQILLEKIGKYIGFCLYRRSYLLCSPVNNALQLYQVHEDIRRYI